MAKKKKTQFLNDEHLYLTNSGCTVAQRIICVLLKKFAHRIEE